MFIEDQSIQRALDWLRDNAQAIADAKGERTYCHEKRKSLKAILFNEAEGTIADRENFAYSHEIYLEHLEKYKAAVIEDEKFRIMVKAAEIKIDVWRTQQVNIRRGA